MCVLSSAHCSGRIPALLLLAPLFLIQARMPLAFLPTWAPAGSGSASVDQHPQGLSHPLQLLCPSLELQGVIVARGTRGTKGTLEPHAHGLGPEIQPVQVPLHSLPTLQHIDTATQLGVICQSAHGRLNPLMQISMKNVKQDWACYPTSSIS